MDFLILLPLPVRPLTLFLAKLSAISIYILLFLFAANAFGALLLPALAPGHIFRALLAHAAAVFAAGLASSLFVIAFEGAVIVLAPERWYRRIAPVVQALLIAGFLTLFLRVFTVGDRLQLLFSGAVRGASWFPRPLWFQAIYEVGLGGATATPFARTLMQMGWWCFPALLVAVTVIYPAAWLRRHRMALEGARSAHPARRQPVAGDRSIAPCWRKPPISAPSIHFTRKTLARLSRYHVLLAVYAGSGLALSVAGAVGVTSADGGLHWSLWRPGVQAVMPMLLFWTVAGLRVAFSLPEDIASRWIFRMAPLETSRVVSTVKRLVACACALVIVSVCVLLSLCGWAAIDVLGQCVLNTCFAVLMIDAFFFLESSIPFTRPRMGEQASLPLTLAVFLFGIPVCMLLMLTLEHWVAHSIVRLVVSAASAAAVHACMHFLRLLPSHPVSRDAFLGETDTDVQTLGLSA